MPVTDNALPHLLVVDDEPDLCDFAAEVGELAGFRVTQLSDGKELLSAIESEPDVILLDLMMPGVDGVEAMRVLAASAARARIVLMSGVDRKVLESATLLGQSHGLTIGAHVQKPVRAAELRAILEGQLAKLRAPASAPRGPQSDHNFSIAELEVAIAQGQLFLHFQPQVAFSDGRWTGVEALVRWQHPRLGLVPPGLFVVQAERNGLGLAMTYSVLEMALSQCAVAGSKLGFDGTLSINLPASALGDVEFPEGVRQRVQALGCGQAHLSFEITESSVSWDSSSALDILTRLRMRGHGVAIDDFGTGHSSLDRLHRFPFNELKIDMSFVREAATSAEARAIVENSIQLAKRLGMTSVAEGVEDAAAWRWLRDAGCDVAQGYFVSRPVPAEQIGAWLERWRAPD